eukprot:15471330-Alexandrium_andersonii.AAC.1
MKRVIHFRKSDGIYVLEVLMAPSRVGNSPAKPVPTGGGREWQQVQSKRAAWRAQWPLQSTGAGSATSSGFTRQGARTSRTRKPANTCIREFEVVQSG